jgi:tetratricopeptide (TPR) repeat protein
MKKKFFFWLVVLLFLNQGLWGIDFDSGDYGDIADYLNGIYGPDDNAGLTAFPLLNIPIGGRAEGMAFAFAAVADDASFLESNPAGSARLDRTELAFFHNNWIADTKIEGAVFTHRFGNLGLAAGGKWLYTPFTEYDLFGNRVSKGYYSEAEAILNGSYNFFSGYNFSGVSLGASIKGAFRFVPDYADKESGEILSGSGREQSAAMAMADLGLLTRFNLFKFYYARDNNASAALVIRNLGPPVLGESLPATITAALAYKPIRPLLFSFDFSLPLNLQDLALSESPYWAAGIEAHATNFLSMRGGIQGKPGNIRLVMGSALRIGNSGKREGPRADTFGFGQAASSRGLVLDINYSLDMLSQLQPMNRLSLGIRVDLGDQGRGAKAARVDELYLEGLEAYAQSDYPRARQCWQEALELNPQFLPALENLAILEEALDVQRRMDALQHLNF